MLKKQMITLNFESSDCCDLIKKDPNVDLFSVRYFDRKQIKIYIKSVI